MIKTPYFTIALVAVVLTLPGGCNQLLEQSPTSTSTTAGPPPLVTTPATAAAPSTRPATRQTRAAGPVRLRPDHPETYLVRPDDTLLKVAGVFLEEPWHWSEVWRPAPGSPAAGQLYSGQIIELYYEQGQPRLRPASGTGIVKLSPQVHAEALSQPIPTVPRSAIAGFLKQAIVVSQAEWEAAPVIVGNFGDRVLLATGNQSYIYVAGLDGFDQRRYRAFHAVGEYRDPENGQPLGFGGTYVGNAVLEKEGEEGKPAVLVMTENRMEARAGDRLFPADSYDNTELYSFTPKAPPPNTQGQIVSLLGNNVLVGQYQSVVVNLGAEDGMESGDMLSAYSTDRGLATRFGFGGPLPSHKVAMLMLYKVYDRVGYGLVIEMKDFLKAGDRVGEP